MVRSLPIPSSLKLGSRRSLTSPTPPSAASSAASSAVPDSLSARQSLLNDAMRGNPFGTTSPRSKSTQSLVETDDTVRHRADLNADLARLCPLFPNIQIEVFRELLSRFDGDSRFQVCVDQLLRYEAEWVRGRWNVNAETLQHEHTFRSEEYKIAARATLAQELKSLSRSTIEAVLVENNYCYTKARPILQDVARKSWRNMFESMFSFRKKKPRDDDPMIVWAEERGKGYASLPTLRVTGCRELDEELANTLLQPLLVRTKASQEDRDLVFATGLAREEAETYEALFECNCCYDDVPFEEITTCDCAAHYICHGCIRRSISESLFGQGWERSVSMEKGTLNCIAPLVDDVCTGVLSSDVVQRVVRTESQSGHETWKKFEERLATESLRKSNMKLVSCPFCPYAEVDPVFQHATRASGIPWRFKTVSNTSILFAVIALLDLIPILIILSLSFLFLGSRQFSTIFQTSLQNNALKTRCPKFQCQNTSCHRLSCLRCFKSWTDIHVCHETLLTSLRTAVEAARTAAIKRTCPRCGLGFVKASGCNKLTCVCGYVMCYLCRKCLGGNGNNGSASRGEEGYKHFCGHFRVNPGSACTECDKCDLYRTEDEDALMRRAGQIAEKEWRVREGMVGVEGLESAWRPDVNTIPSPSSSSTSQKSRPASSSSGGGGGRSLKRIIDRQSGSDDYFGGVAKGPRGPGGVFTVLTILWRDGVEIQNLMDAVVELVIAVDV